MAYNPNDPEHPDFHATRAAQFTSSAGARQILNNRMERSQLAMRQQMRSTPQAYAGANPSFMEPGATPPAAPGGSDIFAAFAPMGMAMDNVASDLGDAGKNGGKGSSQSSMYFMNPYFLRSFGAEPSPDHLKRPAQKIMIPPRDINDEKWEAVPGHIRRHRRHKPFAEALDYENGLDDDGTDRADAPDKNKQGAHHHGPHAGMQMAHHMQGPSPSHHA